MLKVECESCKAPYQVDERRVPLTGLKMRCPKCGHTFLVTDPSKAAPAKGAVPSKAKATMVGFGPGKGGAAAPPPGRPPMPTPVEDEPALPAVRGAPPKIAPIAKPPPARRGAPPPVALPALDDLDLPALAGDVGLPAPANRAAPPARKPPGPPPPVDLGLDVDLPAVVAPPPRAATAAFGDIDLPSAKYGGADLPASKDPGFGAIDLPSPRAKTADLPMPRGKTADLPMPKSGGFDDLPMIQNDLPLVGGNLPAPLTAGLPVPVPGGGLPIPKAGFGELDLPTLQNDLPQPMDIQAQMPVPVSDDRLLPNRAAPPAAAPPQVAFGELDLPLVDGLPGAGGARAAVAAPPPPPPAAARVPEAVSFGELDLPSDPALGPGPGLGGSLAPPGVGSPHSSGAPAAHGGAGGMAFGEVDLGGGSDGPVLGPPPAMSAGNLAFQEAALPQEQAPAARARATTAKKTSRAPMILGAFAAILVIGGAALEMTPLGAYGRHTISDQLRSSTYAKEAATAADDARKKLAVDTFAAASAAADDLAEQRRRAQRSRPLAAYAAFLDYASQVRFGVDAARMARAQSYLSDIPPNSEPPYLHAARAAQAAASADWAKARQAVDLAMTKEPADGIREDLAVLRGEIALAEKRPADAVTAFTEAMKNGPTARAQFGLARAHYHAGSPAKAREAAETTLKLSPDHAGAKTLRAQLTWELSRDDAAAIKDLDSLVNEKVRKTLGPGEIAHALAAKGWIMMARDRAGDARAAFDDAVKIDPRNVSALVGQGEVLYADSRFTEALTRFDEAVQKDASNLPAVIGAAKTKIALERLADAKTQLTTARQLAPKDMSIALWLAKTEEALGNKKGADQLYAAAVDLADPENPDAIQAFAAYAGFLAAQGRTTEAAAKLDQARSKLPDSAALQRAFGEVAAAQGHYDEAIGHYQSALQKNPNDLGTRFRLGVTYRKMRKLDQAAEELDKVAAADKEYPGIALERGLLFEESGDVQKALEQFQGAFQKAPNDIDLAMRVGAAYVTIGKVDEALPLLNKVKDQRPNSAEANHYIGRAYLKQGGLEAAAAMRYLQRAVELDPNRAEYHLYVAWAANDANPAQLGLARTHVDKALQLDKLLADAYWQRGIVERREGAVNDAIKNLKRALELKPTRHEAHATLAECYEDRNETAAALAEWAKAIAGDDKQPLWRWRYGKLLAEKGQTGEAARHLAFAVDTGKGLQPRPGWLGPAAFEAAEVLRKTGQKKEACEHYQLFMELAAPTAPDRRDAARAIKELDCKTDDR